jgi:hypothetical protein
LGNETSRRIRLRVLSVAISSNVTRHAGAEV